jgi:putative transposase
MSNHYHLCIETPEANLVAEMKWLQNTYTRRHRAWGRCLATGIKRWWRGELPEYYGSLVEYPPEPSPGGGS